MNHRHPLLVALAVAMCAVPLQTHADRDASLARVNTILASAQVRAQLEQLGVDPVEAQERIAALTDEELHLLATDLENLPAGGVLEVIGIVAIVLLILELLDVIDLFKKI
jgi:hypothetical protein